MFFLFSLLPWLLLIIPVAILIRWIVWRDRFKLLTQQVNDLTARIQHLEQQSGLSPIYSPPSDRLVDQPPQPVVTPPEPEVAVGQAQSQFFQDHALSPIVKPAEELAETIVAKAPAPSGEPEAPEPVPATGIAHWEAVFGGRWLNRIGVVAIVLGIGFFLKYAIDNQWIGETGRVIIGLLSGLALLGAGERFQRKGYSLYAQGLTGGGIVVLYLSLFAAFNFYHLIPQALAFAFMALVTTTAVTLAVRYDALAIAVLGILGGFLTPYLLSTGVNRQIALFTYVAILDLGILGIAYFKDWRFLNLFSFTLTVLTFAGWYVTFYETQTLWTTFSFLTLFFLVFAFLAIIHNVVHRRRTDYGDHVLILANTALYFGTSFYLLDPGYHDYMGLFAATMAAFHLGIGYIGLKRNPDDTYLTYYELGLAVTFLTLAIPIQLKQHWITVAWAVEGAVLTWIGFREASPKTRVGALIILGLVVVRLFLFESNPALRRVLILREGFTPLFNNRGLAFAVGIAALFFSAYLFNRHRDQAGADERRALPVLVIVANLLVLWFLSVETINYFDFKVMSSRLTYPDSREMENAKQLTLSAIWMVYAMVLITAGILRRFQPLRLLAILLFSIAILKVFLYDLALREPIQGFVPLLNKRGMVFALEIAALFFSAYLFNRHRHQAGMEERRALLALVMAATLLVLWFFSVETITYFDLKASGSGMTALTAQELKNAKQLTLSAIWMVYAMVLITAGILRRFQPLRLLAIALFGVTILKVFLYDLNFLKPIYRIPSFIGLGLILLVASFLYQRFRRQITDFILGDGR